MGALPYGQSRLVAVNERGNRIGEDHWRAKLSNAEIDLIHELLDPSDGSSPLSQRQVAKKFEVSRGTIGDIAAGRRRSDHIAGAKRIPCSPFEVRESMRRLG